jgi:putative endonuclease
MDSLGSKRQRHGRRGERLASWFLEQRGYRVRERNLPLGRFEIDLVVRKGDWPVFVEVKTRSGSAWERAGASLRAAQRRRLAAAASAYAARERPRQARVRFDVISIDEDQHSLVIEHHLDALGSRGELR